MENKNNKEMKKLIILFSIIMLNISFTFAQIDTSVQQIVDSNEIVQSSHELEIEKALKNLQEGLAEFEAKIDDKSNEIQILSDSMKLLIENDTNGNYIIVIDSLKEKIEINKEIIDALTKGIDDINESIEDLQDELSEIKDDTIKFIVPKQIKTVKKRKFKGHWSGLQLGVNTFTYNKGLNLPTEMSNMNLEQFKSWEFSINPFQISIPFFNRYVGAVTGIGFTFNNYELLNNVRFSALNGNLISTIDTSYTYSKNRFKTSSLTVPLILEFQIRTNKKDKRVYLGAGVVGSMNIGTKMKYIYQENNFEVKTKDKTTYFPVSQFSYTATVRLGYKDWYVYANYSLVPLFENNPVIYPASAGIGLKF